VSSALPLGPFEIAELSVEGVVLALLFLLALAGSLHVGRRHAVPARLVLEAYIAAVPAAAVAGRLPAVLSRWTELSREPAVLLDIVLAPGATLPAAVAVGLVVAVLAWAGHGAWRRFLDAVIPGGALLAATFLALPYLRQPRPGGSTAGAAAVAGAAAMAGFLLARHGVAPLQPALVAGEGLALAQLVRCAADAGRSPAWSARGAELLAALATLVALLLLHVVLAGPPAQRAPGREP
jgi:hypothetical protein